MQLTHFTPYRLQHTRHSRPTGFFDDLFHDIFGPVLPAAQSNTAATHHSPQVDIYEKDDIFVIEAEMAGMAKEDISVDIHGHRLTLSGEVRRKEEVEDERSLRRERSFGRFERSFRLPFEVEADQVQATLANGVLRLEIAKPLRQQPRQITIN